MLDPRHVFAPMLTHATITNRSVRTRDEHFVIERLSWRMRTRFPYRRRSRNSVNERVSRWPETGNGILFDPDLAPRGIRHARAILLYLSRGGGGTRVLASLAIIWPATSLFARHRSANAKRESPLEFPIDSGEFANRGDQAVATPARLFASLSVLAVTSGLSIFTIVQHGSGQAIRPSFCRTLAHWKRGREEKSLLRETRAIASPLFPRFSCVIVVRERFSEKQQTVTIIRACVWEKERAKERESHYAHTPSLLKTFRKDWREFSMLSEEIKDTIIR